ncbi:pleckstrin homology domain-containing family G member 5 isoform X4 [Folsomia candida]|uniref:pleckstrin homology domain-containing family G member 5 isoform X4 n=1 Tax=Folsomia candida TaxID=158441 RepID=UPI0016051334|nr:pleckstrin homology domain-containing family G member 5 isoform X4 [Folsomia candida]
MSGISGNGGKMSLPMNLMFESLLKLDPILSGISSQMGPICEESSTGEWGNGSVRVSESRKLFKKNSSLRRFNSGISTTLPTRGLRSPSLSLNFEEISHDKVLQHNINSGRFERSGSSKSYAKNRRSPLSRLWQMRRKSFSHCEFELSPTNDTTKELSSPSSAANGRACPSFFDVDAATAGVFGFFSFLDEDHWEAGDDVFGARQRVQHGTLPKSKSSSRLCGHDNSQRVSSNSSDDYGFLRPRARSKSLVESNSLIFDLDDKNIRRRGKINTATSDFDDEDDELFNAGSFVRSNANPGPGLSGSKRSSNLRRRKACYRDKRSEGRSRSLTQIHHLDSGLGMSKQDMDCKSEPGHPNDQAGVLLVPPPAESSSQKSPLQQSKRGKNRFFSASAEDTTFGGSTNSNLSPAGPNSNSQDASQTNASSANTPTAGPGSAPVSAAKKRSLLSLSSPKYYQRQSRHPSGVISHEGSLKVKNATKQHRWSSLFTTSVKESSKIEALSDHLDNYEKYGIPRPNAILCDKDELESINSLEADWRPIVERWGDLTYRAKQQQSAIWELVESEVLYLKTLELLTDLFLACLYNLQSANILNEIDRDKIFANIPEIYKANKTLWLECLWPMVQIARDTRKPLNSSELHSGFHQFAVICKPYIQYCLEQPISQEYCRANDQRNPLFKVYLAWCEARPECNRERLTDILVRPLQRMTKYSLLLGAILKYTDDPGERLCLEEMIDHVERFVMSVNAALRNQQESERLQGIMDKMEFYDVVDTKDEELELVIKSHSRLNLFEPMPSCGSVKRWLIFESDMRLRDSFSSKIDVRCFLFTDMLLICKQTTRQGDKLKIIRQPYMVDKLVAREYNKDPCSFGLVYLNEYGTAIAALALHGRDNKLVKQWLEHIKKATKLYLEAKAKTDENLEFPLTGAHLIGELPDTDAGIELEDEENSSAGLIYLPPQNMSSRASQMSSLLHSHSGSIEMNETSLISSRARSFEQELRGSSLSSEEGTNGNDPSSTGATGNLSSARSLSVETGPQLRPVSPRHDRRRLFISKSPSPNSLSVQIPVPNILGQSLPNLNASPPQPQSLTVPKCSLSPTHRGISYPPPSPRGLRRSQALLSSLNPPLTKVKQVGCISPEKSPVTPTAVVEIKDPIPPSNDVSPSVPPEDCFNRRGPRSPTLAQRKMVSATAAAAIANENSVKILHSNPDTGVHLGGDVGENCNMARRLARNERMDNKRYYTAGVIEDIKKENTREKDSAIQKRLSWNHGPQTQLQSEQSKLAAEFNRKFFSDVDTPREVGEIGFGFPRRGGSSSSTAVNPRTLPDVLIAVSEPEERGGGPANKCFIEPSSGSSQRLNNSPANQRRLIGSLRTSSAEDDHNVPSEDEEFDSLAYQRATGSIKIRKNKVDMQQGQSKSFNYEDQKSVNPTPTTAFSSTKPMEGEGSKKPKDLLNRLLTDGSLESSDV